MLILRAQGSVGKVFPGVDVRLSDGNEGEVLVKSANLFTEYATASI